MKLLNPMTIVSDLNLPEVTETRLFVNNEPVRGGLYDPIIFGTIKRFKFKLGHIKLPFAILHPLVYELARRYFPKYLSIAEGKLYWDTVNKMFVKSSNQAANVVSGLEALERYTPEILNLIRENTSSVVCRNLINTLMSKFWPDQFFTRNIIVPPAILRPYHIQGVSKLSSSKKTGVRITPDQELTIKYLYIVRYVSQLNELSEFGEHVGNEIRWTVSTLYHNIVTIILKRVATKEGLLRSSVLGKRVDFSGRAVITVDPKIAPYEIGIPFRMAVRIFKPFILHYFRQHPDRETELNYSAQNLDTFLESVYKNLEITEKQKNILIEAMTEVMNNKYVIAKRDPALHRLSLQAFKPVLVFDNTIHINPMVCSAYNADFDGDQMAVYVPLTEEGQRAAEKLCHKNNLLMPGKYYELAFLPEKDFILGLYYITAEPKAQDRIDLEVDPTDLHSALLSLKSVISSDPSNALKYCKFKTYDKPITVGRAFITTLFFDLTDGLIIDAQLNKKTMKKIARAIAKNIVEGKLPYDDYGYEILNRFQELIHLGGTLLTKFIKPHDIRDFILPPELEKRKQEIIAKYRDNYEKMNEEFAKLLDDFAKYLREHESFVVDMIESGARGKWGNVMQLAIAKGIIVDAQGNVREPILSSITEGMDKEEFFRAGYASRKGVNDRSQNTRHSGYLTRKLVYAATNLKLSYEKCQPLKLFRFKLMEDFAPLVLFRYIRHEGKDVLITENNVENFVNREIELYSPIYCRSGKNTICKRCYGELYRVHRSSNIGIIAAQTIGERGSQLIMRTFHTGGVAEFANIKSELEKDFFTHDLDLYDYFDIDEEQGYLVPKRSLTVIFNIDFADKSCINEGYIVTDVMIIVENDIRHYIELSLPVRVNLHGDEEFVNKEITIRLAPNEKVIQVVRGHADITNAVMKTDKILELTWFRVRDKLTPESLVLRFARQYLNEQLPLVHFEVIVSNMARDPDDLTLPYRLSSYKKPPRFISIKRVPYYTNALLGLCFEDISLSIATGLTIGKEERESIDLLSLLV